jgi:hypothetical protein
MWQPVFDEKLALRLAHDQMNRIANTVREVRPSIPVEAQQPPAGKQIFGLRFNRRLSRL